MQKNKNVSGTAQMSYSSKPNTSLAKTTFKGDEFKKNDKSEDAGKLLADIKSVFKKLQDEYKEPKDYRALAEQRAPEYYKQLTA